MDKAVKLTDAQIQKALELNEGGILPSYTIEGQIKIETEEGLEPYTWINAEWVREIWN